MAKQARAKRTKPTFKKPVSKPKQATKTSAKIPSSFSLLVESSKFLYKHKKKLLGVGLVFFVLYLLIVRASSSFNIESTQQLISDELGNNELANKALLTGVLIGSGGSSSTSVGSMSTFVLLVMGCLVFIWSIRHLTADKAFRVRDAYYKGMYPLIPFIIVVFIISLQLIPFIIGGFLYTTSEINGLITSAVERVLFVSGWIALGLLSVYWLANSLMAVYAVTLPDIYPMQALRSTKQVVKNRRWTVFMKIFMLFVYLLMFSATILFLVVVVAPAIAVYVYDLLWVFVLLFANIYLFKLYRSLI